MSDALPLLSVKELKSLDKATGKPFASIVLLRRLITKTASNGNPFLSIELGDRAGSFACTVFGDSPHHDLIKQAGEGAVLRIEGRIDYFQGRLSPRLNAVSVCDEEELQADPSLLENLVETCPEDAELLWKELHGFIDGIPHDELRMTVRIAMEELGDAFKNAPAAVSMHHAYRNGLLEHTIHMERVAKAILPLYPEVDPSLTMAGILLHDTGKVTEYEGSLTTRRSRKGILQGHVVLGYQVARKAGLKARLDADRLERLEHVILSHQGEPEWGAAVYAATPEAVLVSMIDNLDARMGMVQRALRQAAPDTDFSDKIPGLNAPLLTRPLPAPTSQGPACTQSRHPSRMRHQPKATPPT